MSFENKRIIWENHRTKWQCSGKIWWSRWVNQKTHVFFLSDKIMVWMLVEFDWWVSNLGTRHGGSRSSRIASRGPWAWFVGLWMISSVCSTWPWKSSIFTVLGLTNSTLCLFLNLFPGKIDFFCSFFFWFAMCNDHGVSSSGVRSSWYVGMKWQYWHSTPPIMIERVSGIHALYPNGLFGLYHILFYCSTNYTHTSFIYIIYIYIHI